MTRTNHDEDNSVLSQMGASPLLVSVVIPCRDDTYLESMLASLQEQQATFPFEVVVVIERVQDAAARFGEWGDGLNIRFVTRSQRARAGANRNLGVAESAGHLILFVDADDAVNDVYVQAMATALESKDLVCSSVDLARLNPWDPSGRSPQETGLINSLGFLPFAGAGTLGIRRALFEESAGFDPLLRCYEDADLCWRIQLAGHDPPAFVPDATLYVRRERSLVRRWFRATAFGRTQALLYRRYRSAGMPRESLRNGVMAWVVLLSRLLRTAAGGRANSVGNQIAMRVGRLLGSIRFRTPYF